MTSQAEITRRGNIHFRDVDLDETAAEAKGSGGVLHWLNVMNMTASVVYLHIYDKTAANVNVSPLPTPDFTIPVPTQGDTNGAGLNIDISGNGQQFENGVTFRATTTVDGTIPSPQLAANSVFVNAGLS